MNSLDAFAEARDDPHFCVEKVNGKMCIVDMSPDDVPLVEESWFQIADTQHIPESPAPDVEEGWPQSRMQDTASRLPGTVAVVPTGSMDAEPRTPSESRTKPSQSDHGESPRRAPGSPITLAAARLAQSHVEAVLFLR